MKTGKLGLESFTIICPFCEEVVPSTNGSEFHTPAEVEPGQVMKCPHCGKDFRLPKKITASAD